jgi:hypothetical protein
MKLKKHFKQQPSSQCANRLDRTQSIQQYKQHN